MRTVLLLLLFLAGAGCGRPSGFPERPVTIVCPWGQGGGSDTLARHLGALLQQELGVAVNVQNVTGGDGVTGHSEGARATADGYTLTLLTVEINMLHWRGMTPLTWRDFAPVGLVNRDAAAVFVRSDSPWGTLPELEAHVRKNPGKLRASGTGKGGIWHIALAGWLAKIGLQPADINWIPFRGAAPSMQELLGNGLEVVCCSLPEARTFLDRGDVRCLGLMAQERAALFPKIPTLREQGIDWSMGAWRGLGAPRATPVAALRRLIEGLERVVRGEKYRKVLQDAGFGTADLTGGEAGQEMHRVDVQMGALLTTPAFRSIDQTASGAYRFPALVGAALVAVLAALVLPALRHPRGRGPSRQAALRFLEIVVWTAVYIAWSGTLGFVLTAAAILLVVALRLGVRVPAAVAMAVLVAPAVYHVFAVLLTVPLPRGILGW
jgi:tripartite-type tricarboxylate transporter receptor subunit TctC